MLETQTIANFMRVSLSETGVRRVGLEAGRILRQGVLATKGIPLFPAALEVGKVYSRPQGDTVIR